MAPAAALRAQGHDVTVVYPDLRTGEVGLRGSQNAAGTLVSVEFPPDADVIVLQRVTMVQLAQAVALIRARGVAVVVDMDDDLSRIDPRNIAWTVAHPKRGRPGHSWANAAKACLDATLVTVSTPALLKTYAPHGRGVVIDNFVPAKFLDVDHRDSDTIGWPGSVHSHPGDLQVVGPAAARVVREGHPFLAVGEGIGVREALGLRSEPSATGLVPLAGWAAAVARLGVGMAPLADTSFNSAKSRLKILEMSAVGVPWVASPRAEYTRFHKLGCGRLATTPKDWYRQLRELAGSAALREELSLAGRSVAARNTIERNSWRWAAAWEQAWKAQRQAATSVFVRR